MDVKCAQNSAMEPWEILLAYVAGVVYIIVVGHALRVICGACARGRLHREEEGV